MPQFRIASIVALALASTSFAQVISEIRVDEPGFDLSEYVEISGAPGTSLAGLSIVAVGDGDAASPNGVVEAIVALSGAIPASGHFLVAEATFSLSATPDQYSKFEFESSDNVTYFLVDGFTGGIGSDIDANDDGIADAAPWTSVLSSVALVRNASPDGVTDEFFYSASTVGPESADSPAHAFLCSDSAAWKAGALDPAAGSDSPGAANAACGVSIVLTFSELRTKQPGTDIDEYVEFVGTPGASLAGLTYVVIGDRTAPAPADYVGVVEMALPLDGAVVPSDGRLVIAEPTVTFPLDVNWITPADGLMFEDSSTTRTHLVVSGWSGTVGVDLDLGNDGTLDATPWLSVIDSVAFEGPYPTDQAYSVNLIPVDQSSSGSYTAAHAYRCDPTGAWEVGALTFYAGGGDTPGDINRACDLGSVPECGEPATGSCALEHAGPFCDDTNCCNSVCAVDPACCVTAWDAACVAQAAVSCAAATSSCDFVDVRINEVRIDMTSTDLKEFVELAGTPGTPMDELTLVVIGDGSATGSLSGVVERARALTGVVMPADGTLLIGNPGVTPDVGNGAGNNGADVLQDWLENSDNLSIFLVRGWTGAVAADLDTNNDGVFDSTPWTEVVDSIALVESATNPPVGTEYAYGSNRIGPDGVNVPGHVWRCQDTGCWNIGLFDPIANGTAGNETPGVDNVGCDTAACDGDFNADGVRDGADLGTLLAGWGTSSGDINGDGMTDGADLGILLAAFGLPCG